MKNVSLSDVKPNPSNPRFIRDENFKKLVQSLKDFPEMMEARPIVVNKDMMILGGNMRYKAAQEAGYKEIAVKVVDWSEDKQKEFIIKDNVSGGEWDWDILANEWEQEQLEDWGLDTKQNWESPEAEEDEAPEVDETSEPESKLGEVYQLGRHRVMCGDSTKIEDVEKLMDGKKADMVFTDPPYSSGGSQESGKTSGSIGARGQKTIKNDNLSTRGYRLLMNDALGLSGSCNSVFIFCDWKMWIETFDISERAGYRVRNMIVWDKMQMGMGMPFRNQHELCLFGSKIAGKIGNGNTPNVLQYSRDREAEHATPKPVGLICDLIKQVENDNVYDPFLGSGSTLIACEQTNRTCYGMELDPKYCDVIRKRYHKFVTGNEDGWQEATPAV